jgi:hypothetical protein
MKQSNALVTLKLNFQNEDENLGGLFSLRMVKDNM